MVQGAERESFAEDRMVIATFKFKRERLGDLVPKIVCFYVLKMPYKTVYLKVYMTFIRCNIYL